MGAPFAPGALRPMLQRGENARRDFVDMIVDQHPFSESDAVAILDTLLRLRLAKVDYGVGRVMVKHGGFLERAALVRILAHSKEAR